MPRTLLLMLSLTASSLAAQQFTVDASQTTATQALLTYTPLSNSACMFQVSESPSLSPLDHDVDSSLFPGANLDSRAGTVVNGAARTFVAGTRRSDLATDNKLYSRALQANTQHYYQVTCGSTSVTGQFMTANPPLGNSYSDNPPFNAVGFGNYGWPTIDWIDQTKVYIDPLTGIALKRFTQPGAFGFQGGSAGSAGSAALPVYWDLHGTWTNAAYITSGASTALATYSGASSDPIFVAWDNNNLNPSGAPLSGYSPIGFSLDSLQLNLFGNGTDATAANRTVSVCLAYYDSQTCETSWYDIVLPQSLGSTPVNYPGSTTFPNGGFWAGWGTVPPRSAFGVWAAAVSVNGNTVSNASGSFNTAWKAGGKYYLAGSSPACTNNLCTIASITNNQLMTIVETPGTLTNVQGYSATAGFLIRKKTGTGSVSISASSQYAASYQNLLPGTGSFQLCEPNPVTVSYDADGVTPITPVSGELCLINSMGTGASSAAGLYLLIPSTGSTRFLNPMFMDAKQGVPSDYAQRAGIGGIWGVVDPASPTTFYFSYTYGPGVNAGKTALIKAQYQTGPQCVFQAYPAGANHPALYASSGAQPGMLPHSYPGVQAHDSMDGQSSCMAYTNVTLPSQGRDIDSQIQTQSNYKPIFGTAGGISNVLGGKALAILTPGAREEPGLLYVFDLATGNLQSASDTFSTYPLRWAAIHSASQQGSDRFIGFATSNGLGYYSNFVPDPGYFRGPYTFVPTAVWKLGAWSSDTSLPADSSINVACPAGLSAALVANGATGTNCIQFQSKMACNTNPYKPSSGQTEAQAFPCPYNPAYSMLAQLAPGDNIRNVAALQAGGTVPYEFLQIVQVTSLGSNLWQFTASRVANSGRSCDPNYPNLEAWPNRWAGIPVSQCNSDFFTDTTNLAGGYFPVPTGSHYSSGVGSSGENPTTVTAAGQGISHYIYYQQPFAAPTSPPSPISSDVFFHGMEAPSQFQSYPSNMQMSVTDPNDKSWFLDFHTLNPSYGGGWEFPTGNTTVFQTPATLVPGTSNVWKFGAPTGKVNFKTQPVIAYAGGYLLKDVSSPATGNVITDSTTWKYCVAYAAGECRSGSKGGEAYLSVPLVGGGYAGNIGYCNSNTVQWVMPCATTLAANAAQIIQSRDDVPDPHALNWRRLGFGLMGPGRQYEFSTAVPDPTGSWAVFACNWCDGVRNELFMAKLPKLPGSTNQTQIGNDFQILTVTLGPSVELDQARVRFGYAENGDPASLFCTTRQENCSTTTNSSMSFAYESEGPVWQSCSAGCTIQVPALPGRVLYYAVDRKSSTDGRNQLGNPLVKANP
jgi:hypothetical protein